MENKYQNNVEPRFDWGQVSDVEYLPSIQPQNKPNYFEPPNYYEPPKVQNSFHANGLITGILSGLLLAVFIIVSIFGGIAFLNSKVTSPQGSIERSSERTERSLRRFVNTENLNLRSAPSRTAGVVKILPFNTEVELLNKTEFVDGKYWVKVKSGNYSGWVNRDYLR